MPDITYQQTVAVGGVTISGNVTRSAEGQLSQVVPLPVAKSGTLSTRTDDNTGELTLGTGHGITTGATINLYWAGGNRYGVTVGTVVVNAVPIDLGAGDNLPIATTAITAAVVVAADIAFDGDQAIIIAAQCDQIVHCDVQESGGTQIVGLDLLVNEPWVWTNGGPSANPVASHTVGKIVAANSSSTAAATLRFGTLYDSAP